MPMTDEEMDGISKQSMTRTQKSPDPGGFTADFHKHRKNQYQFSQILPKKQKKREHFPTCPIRPVLS